MNKDFVSFEIAKKLKEKGFECDHPFAMYSEEGVFYDLCTSAKYITSASGFKCRCYYDYEDFDEHDCVAPTISQVLKWLREEKKLFVEIFMYHSCYLYEIYNTEIYDVDFTQKSEKYSEEEYASYEQAALAGIEYAIDNLL